VHYCSVVINELLFLNEARVRQHLRMTDLIPAMEKALIVFSAGKVTQPVRSVIKVDPPGGFLGLMPALTPEGLGLKAVTFYPSNAERGIPTHMATIFLVDPGPHAARDHGRKVDYRDAHGGSLSRRDETSRGARRENSRYTRKRCASAQSPRSVATC
jgi:hypothetical protein